MGWTEVRDAVQAAIVAASGLSADKVVWGFQDADAPLNDYVSLSLGSVLGLGIDYLQTSTDLTRPAGQEIKLDLKGTREVSLEVSCFTVSVADSSDALALGERIKGSLIFPDVRAIMGAQGVTPFDPGPVQYVPDVPNTTFRGRSTCSIRCYMPAQALAEYTTYIEKVNGTLTYNPGAHAVPFHLGPP